MRSFLQQFQDLYKPLLIMPLLLAILSITMMVSTSYDDGIVISREVIVQSAAYIIGIGLILIIINIDYTVFQDVIKWIYIGSIALLLLVYVPFIGVEHFGARSWINLGFMDVQPSEIVKITFMILLADYLEKHKNDLRTFTGLGKVILYCAPFILIVVKEDLGSALVFIAIFIAMVFYAGLDYRVFAKCAAVVILLIPFAYRFMAPHQKVRIDAFLHPNNLSLEGNYQVYQSKIAIGSGGLFGKGIVSIGSLASLGYISDDHTDMIFSIVCEAFGYVGGGLLILLFLMLIIRLVQLSNKVKDPFGSFCILGVAAMFMFHILENIGMVIGLMPCTGIPLPFISYGGSHMLSCMMAIGLVMNVVIRDRMENHKPIKRRTVRL